MEEIVLQLLNDDAAIKEQGFLKLTEAYKNAHSTTDLFQILHASTNPKVRQYVAVLLKKRLVNAKHWFRVPQVDRTEYKAAVLKQLVNEEVAIQRNLVDLINTITRHELTNPSNNWPELFDCIQRLINSKNFSDKEVGISLIPVIAANRPETLTNHEEWIVSFLTKTLQSLQELNNTVLYNILLTILHLAPAVTNDLNIKNAFHDTMSQVIHSVQALTEFEKNQSTEVLRLLDELCKNTPDIVSLHAVVLVTTYISIAENRLSDVSLRVKALENIKWLVDSRNKTIRNNELVVPIVDMIYSVLTEPVDNELGDFYLKALTSCDSTPITCAMQILHILSEHLPPQELVAEALRRTEMMFEERDVYVRRGCYLGLAVIVERCSAVIEKDFLKYLRQSFTESDVIMRNTVQFTLARFTKHLEINFDEYADELLPVLYDYLDNSLKEIKENKNLQTIDTLFYMLDEFSEVYGDQTIPNLPKLIDYLFGILESDCSSNRIKKLAVKSFVAVTNGVHGEMLPYYPRLINILKTWVAEKHSEETAELQAQIFATFESLGWRLDETEILPVAEYFSKIGIQTVKTSTNSILKAAIYSYFASTSYTAPEIFTEVLSHVFDDIIKSVQILENTKINQLEDVKNEDILTYQEQNNTDVFDFKENDDRGSIQDLVKITYLNEKKAAIEALGLLYVNLEQTFLPYLERSYREVVKTINYPETIISHASLNVLSDFYRVSSKLDLTESNHEMLISSSEILVTILSTIIHETNDINLLTSAAQVYANVVRFVRSESSILESIKNDTAKCIEDILSDRTRSQNLKETYVKGDDFAKYEAKEMLKHYFRSSISSEELLIVFEQLLPLFLRYSDGEFLTPQYKNFGIDLISDCFRGLEHGVSKFASQLVPLFIQSVDDSELGPSAVQGIMLMIRYGGSAIYSYYSDIQKVLVAALQKETDNMRKDNVTSALGSLIWTNYSILPIEEIFPILVNHLPLDRDIAEYKTVFGAILTLFRDRHAVLDNHVQSLIKIVVNVLQKDLPVDYKKVNELATEILRIVRQDYSDVWKEMRTFLSPEEVSFAEKLNI